jgi:excisionase family DNA binding protein
MARITSQKIAANYLHCHDRTISRWISEGLIRGYLDGNTVLVDLDEIEDGFKTNPRLRDPRRPKYGAKAVLVPIPVTAAPGTEADA